VAIYSRQRLGMGFDLGWIFGRSTQLRAGYDAAYVRNVTRVGDLLPRSRGAEQAARLGFDYDGQDRAYFATRGLRFTSKAAWVVHAPEAPRAFGTAEAALSVAWRMARRQQAAFYADGGVSFGQAPPILYQFSLGGPFRLGAFPPNAFRGPNLLLGGAAYRAQIGRLPTLLGDRLYLTGLLEIGTVFDRLKGATFKSSVSGGLAADTFFGPVFAGASVGDGGTVRAYFIVGTRVR
jgi:outer membrane protein assembly factor BamA